MSVLEELQRAGEPGAEAWAGSKAAGLASAAARGAPVLPGVVVPAVLARAAVAPALEELQRAGSYAAQLKIMGEALAADLAGEVTEAARRLGSSIVVRSSSPKEGDPSWAGTFASFVDLRPEEVATAVLGCWASALRPEALFRCEAEGCDVLDACPAVLIQPFVAPRVSGVATVDGAGTVRVTAVAGAPAPLLSGWAPGAEAVRDPAGIFVGEAVDIVGPPGLEAVAALLEAAAAGRGPTAIEWAQLDHEPPLLLQVGASAAAEPAAPSPPPRSRRGRRLADVPRALSTARALARYAGALGETMVLPWLLASPGLPAPAWPAPTPEDRAAAVWHEATAVAADLVAAVWDAPPEAAAREASATLRALVTGADPAALARWESLGDVPKGAAEELLLLLGGVATRLVSAGALAKPEELWGLDPRQVPSLLETGRREVLTTARPALRWQEFLEEVIVTSGRRIGGEGASPGRASGFGRFIERPEQLPTVIPGEIVVLAQPLPGFAPALWVAGGLVSRGGSAAAHLVEVARSLRVPAVVGIEEAIPPFSAEEPRPLLHVDGDGAVYLAAHA